jgi:N-acetylmuramoyl-L-alanine amidase
VRESDAATASGASPDTVAPTSAPAEAIVVRGLSHTTLPRGDRLTLELSGEGVYTTERLIAPDELTLTLRDTKAAEAIVEAASTIKGSRIRSMRMQQTDKGVQVVVRLEGHPRHSEFPLYGPYRLVLDFESEPAAPTSGASAAARPSGDRDRQASADRPTPQAMPVASNADPDPPVARESSARVPAAPAATAVIARVAPTASTPMASHAPAESRPVADTPAAPVSRPAPPRPIGGGYSLARQLGLGVSRIVIDPGHGGSDPGASANGVTEASLVLDVALRLEKLLRAQPGFEVVLTRRTNAAVPLARRTAMANEEAADLFLSIHANSSPRRTTAGVETYYLNFSSTPEAESVAARENASSPEAMHALPSLVRAIATNNKLAESRELAGAVQSSLVRRLGPRNKDFKDLGVKQAPFVVLIGAQMPSVLAEIGFLTNRAEAGLVKQNAYKQQIAQALCDAILRYQASLKKSTTVAETTDGR